MNGTIRHDSPARAADSQEIDTPSSSERCRYAAADQQGGCRRIAAERLVQLDRLPADGEGGEPAVVVSTHTLVSAMPPTVTWLDTHPQRWPGEIDADLLPIREIQLMLPHGVGESDRTQRLDQVQLEPALGWPTVAERLLEPALESECPVLAHPAVVRQICGSGPRCDEAQVPTVLSGSLESPIIQTCCEVVQHAVGFCDHGPAHEATAVSSAFVPAATSDTHPVGEPWSVARRNDDAEWVMWHLPQSLQPPCGRSREEAAIAEVKRHSGASSQEGVGSRDEPDRSTGHIDEEASTSGP